MKTVRLFLAMALVILVVASVMVAQAPPAGGGGQGAPGAGAGGGGRGPGGGGGGGGQGRGGGRGGGGIPAPLVITIASYEDGAMIPAKHGGAQGVSPAMTWTGAPMTTQSFALIFHDLDVGLRGGTEDVLHWMIWDIPGTATSLPEGVKAGDQADGSRQGRGISGQNAYFGPAPPAPTTHHYTIELYALSAKLNLPPETTRAQLLAAMEGKVVAKGAYNGRFKQ
jgi:Raf kinase inhibitor-like YbhB/YbcL family protein